MSSSEALPQTPHDEVAKKFRESRSASKGFSIVTVTTLYRCSSSSRSSQYATRRMSWTATRPSVNRNPAASSKSPPGVRIVTATRCGVLAGALRADLEGLLGGERVRPFRPGVSVHRDDPHGRDVATNLLGAAIPSSMAPREA